MGICKKKPQDHTQVMHYDPLKWPKAEHVIHMLPAENVEDFRKGENLISLTYSAATRH